MRLSCLSILAALCLLGACTPNCDESLELRGQLDGVDLSTLDLDGKGGWVEGSFGELIDLNVGLALGLLGLLSPDDAEDTARLAYFERAAVVLRGRRGNTGAYFDVYFYDVMDRGLDIDTPIPIVDASSLNTASQDDGTWQAAFRDIIDGMRDDEGPKALVFITLDPDPDHVGPAFFQEAARHPSGGVVTIHEAWNGLDEIESYTSGRGGPFGNLGPVDFEVDMQLQGSSATIDGQCVE